jgi:hypothetical protein
MKTLDSIKNDYDYHMEWLFRQVKTACYNIEYLKGLAEGLYIVYSSLISQLPYDAYPKITRCAGSDDQIGFIEIFNEMYPIYLDDPGQSFYIKLQDKEYGLGSFNTCIEPDVAYIVFRAIHDKNLSKIKEMIKNG